MWIKSTKTNSSVFLVALLTIACNHQTTKFETLTPKCVGENTEKKISVFVMGSQFIDYLEINNKIIYRDVKNDTYTYFDIEYKENDKLLICLDGKKININPQYMKYKSLVIEIKDINLICFKYFCDYIYLED